ncbi:MAG TPA: methyl-accepting chemotaxis protein [Candidimonas sp.]|nr:methyl-accepting chemotaxis protein [Candidimonas sp.]
MRQNLAVTRIETKVRADQYLISKTDINGNITYANPAFIEISGYSREELIGQPHNMVRHPDMPAAAFKDLWDTLQARKPWLGLVKNRRKDGGFYWVLANVVPIYEQSGVTGYASVRVKPSDEQINAAQDFYDAINAGTSNGYTVKHGQRVRTGWRQILDIAALPFESTLRAGMFRMATLSTATIVAATWFAATGGLPPQHRSWMLAALAIATLGNLAYGWAIAQRVIKPLDNAAKIARQIASGNLQIEIDTQQEGEVGNLYFYLDMMRKSLIGIATDVHAGASATARMAEILNNSNANLSTRTDDQAASLQATAARMETLTATVKQNADNANQASQLAQASMQTAQQGGTVVSDVVTTMQGIHESSQKIGDIVTLIESIAFQTNILALNAAVESARAGEAGRGFAIVAGEVRNLAQKSAAAAKDIKTLIDVSVSRMEIGTQQADRAGITMQDIVESVRRVTDIMNEISTASVEQAGGLVQINQAISEMDQVTHQNAAFVHDLGNAAQAMSGEAKGLRLAIEVLNTGK